MAENENFIIVSLYAPTQKKMFPNYERASNSNLIFNGDLNSIIDPGNREGSKKHSMDYKNIYYRKNVFRRLLSNQTSPSQLIEL